MVESRKCSFACTGIRIQDTDSLLYIVIVRWDDTTFGMALHMVAQHECVHCNQDIYPVSLPFAPLFRKACLRQSPVKFPDITFGSLSGCAAQIRFLYQTGYLCHDGFRFMVNP